MFEKYLKYKKKYLALKGGFALSQDCADFGIPPETAVGEDDPEFLYPKIIKYFFDNKDFYDQYLTKINNYSKDKLLNKPDVLDYKRIIDYFNSDWHLFIFKYLLDKFLEDDLQFYHVQYTSLIFLSFIIELELFMILYIYVPYNTETKQDNNNISIDFATGGITKNIYDKLLENDILFLFRKFTCNLESIYKNFIQKLFDTYTQIFIYKIYDRDNFDNHDIEKTKQINMILYNKEEKGDYRHINHNWIEDLQKIFKEYTTIILYGYYA